MEDGECCVSSRLKFEVTSTNIVFKPSQYVAYTITVYKNGQNEDEHPCTIKRRHSEFLDLFIKLRHEFPDLVSSFPFPKKVVIGNFSPEVIAFRRASFEALLQIISKHENMLESPTVLKFIQSNELSEILIIIHSKDYKKAVSRLEISFRLLNKLLTDRHPVVLRMLCLLVACCDASKDECLCRYAKAAVVRFETVSNIDSLRYYVPLLRLCVKVLPESQVLQDRLSSMKRRGIKVDGCPSLLNVVLDDFQNPLSQTFSM